MSWLGLCPKNACDSSGGDSQEQTDPPVDQVEMPHLDRDCYRFTECVDLDNTQASSCRDGYTRMSFDRASCSGNSGLPICCMNSALPMECTWRGSGGDCNDQCHKREVTLFESAKGGDPGESGDSKCSRGHKVFCCGLRTFSAMTSQCRWTECSEKCAGDETKVAQASELEGKCGDCADNTCNNKEVTLILDQGGGDGNLCSWWRKKSLCCTPEEAVFGNGVCPNPYCTILIGDCALDEWAEDDDTDEDACDDHDELRRDEGALAERIPSRKRAKRRRTYQAVIEDIIQNLIEIIIIARAYPGSGTLHSNTRGDPASDDMFELAPGCGNVDVIVKDRKTFTKKQISAAYDTDITQM
ncbi:unnamed protein product [Colletotrichum noveboracense]|uniref:Uncharacterized protein n=1 Tax=Colletotrichum noveboracense TaxID=2664923 RepID=A0A9W4RM47_9PEZI|nr:unnamed protein product [Colletotrichum noveboracense]